MEEECEKRVDFMKPFILDKTKWPYAKDISHWDEQPGRRPFMIFAAIMQQQPEWVSIWENVAPIFQAMKANAICRLKIQYSGLEFQNP